uniref:C-type lectin domain-containing protein n=1 Tax=Maylandia zebra TaxID=106582 RepID=A0A3P9AVB7_9CICH
MLILWFWFRVYWNSGEPNGGRNENCGEIKTYDSEKSWNDESCSNEKFWICEKRAECPLYKQHTV